MAVKHQKTSGAPAPGDPSQVGGPDWNADHTIQNGTITEVMLATAVSDQLVTGGDSHDHAGGDGAAIDEDALSFTDRTTADAVAGSKHGLLPKPSNVATQYLNGQLGWTTPSGSGGIPESIFDAKGDLIAASAADTAARLAVGANGKYLKADSGEATGLLWADPPSGTVPASTTSRKDEMLIGNGSTGWQVAPQFFNVKAYGAVGNGSTDDTNAFIAACDACHAANGGVVVIPPATYVVNDVELDPIKTSDWWPNEDGTDAPTPSVARSGWMVISGYGATLKCTTTNYPSFRFARTADYQTFGLTIFQGFRVDNNNRDHSSMTGLIIDGHDSSFARCNVENVIVRDCETLNVPDRNTDSNSFGVLLRNQQPDFNDTHWNYIRRVVVENCRIRANSIGIYLATKNVNTYGRTKALLDEIIVRNNWVWCGGREDFSGGNSGIMLGYHAAGYRCWVYGNHCESSGDNLIEVDAFNFCYIADNDLREAQAGAGVTMQSWPYSISTPCLYILERNTFRNNVYSGAPNPSFLDVLDLHNEITLPSWGTIIFRDNSMWMDAPSPAGGRRAIRVRCPFDQVIVDGFQVHEQADSSAVDEREFIYITNHVSHASPANTRPGLVSVTNVAIDLTGTFSGTGTVKYACVNVGGKVSVKIDNVWFWSHVTRSSSGTVENCLVKLGGMDTPVISGSARRLTAAATLGTGNTIKPLRIASSTTVRSPFVLGDCDFYAYASGTDIVVDETGGGQHANVVERDNVAPAS